MSPNTAPEAPADTPDGRAKWLTSAPTSEVTGGQLTRLTIEIPADQELVNANISRDGRMVAYIARPRQTGESSEGTTRLFLRSLDASAVK